MQNWPRLNTYSLPEPTQVETLKDVRRRLEASDLEDGLKIDVSRYLRLLETKPKLLARLLTFTSGRKRDTLNPDIALHYLVLVRTWGPGSSEAACTEVAEIWRKEKSKVRDAYTDWRHSAEFEVREMLEDLVGRSPGGHTGSDGIYVAHPPWTETSVLEAMAADLKDSASQHRKPIGTRSKVGETK